MVVIKKDPDVLREITLEKYFYIVNNIQLWNYQGQNIGCRFKLKKQCDNLSRYRRGAFSHYMLKKDGNEGKHCSNYSYLFLLSRNKIKL